MLNGEINKIIKIFKFGCSNLNISRECCRNGYTNKDSVFTNLGLNNLKLRKFNFRIIFGKRETFANRCPEKENATLGNIKIAIGIGLFLVTIRKFVESSEFPEISANITRTIMGKH